MSEELYEALERFSIMTGQSDVSEEVAFSYIQKTFGDKVLKELKDYLK